MFCMLLCYAFYLFCAGVALKIYWKLSTKRNESYTCLVGKTAVVTGANTGLGYYTALDFAKRGAKVVLACRSKERAEDALRKIIQETGNRNVIYKSIDMASLKSVRDFAEDFNRTEDRLDILVNNAGLGFIDEEHTADGIQYLLHANHIGPFLLTHLLLGKLKQSAPSRIVNVSSMAARRASLTLDNLEKINELPPIDISKISRDGRVYSTTKLCNIYFTTELAKKLEGTGVSVNALHPGVINTEFFRGFNKLVKTAANIAGKILLMSPEEGAQTQIYLSVSKDVEGISGGLFANCSRTDLYDTAKDPVLGIKLWEKSEELAKMTAKDKAVAFN